MLSPLLLPKSGTIYLPPLKSHHHLTPSNVTSKNTILPLHNFLTTWRLPRTSDLIFLTLVHYQIFYIALHCTALHCTALHYIIIIIIIITWFKHTLCHSHHKPPVCWWPRPWRHRQKRGLCMLLNWCAITAWPMAHWGMSTRPSFSQSYCMLLQPGEDSPVQPINNVLKHQYGVLYMVQLVYGWWSFIFISALA